MNYILDTNVVSELVAQNPDPHVIGWVDSVDPESLFLSVITIGEIKKGVEKLSSSNHKEELLAWLEQDLLIRFGEHILPIDASVVMTWSHMAAELEKIGKTMPAIDSLIAATASDLGYTLVTRNTADFDAVAISVLNPWNPELD
jgi:toxin FitB